MSRVSIIMTVYNKPRWLNQSIDSVLEQTYDDWELIIMEDNSPDPTVRGILESYLPNDKLTIYYSDITEEDRYKTARYATLINKAVREFSTGEYITYLTDDDFYYPNRLEAMVDYLDENSDVSVVYGSIYNVDIMGNQAGERLADEILPTGWDRVDHNAVMHRREVFFEVDGWEDNAGTWGGADSYFWRRIADAGYKMYPVKEFVAAKRYHQDSVQWLIANGMWPKDSN